MYHIYYVENGAMVHEIVNSEVERKDKIFWYNQNPNIKVIGCLIEWK